MERFSAWKCCLSRELDRLPCTKRLAAKFSPALLKDAIQKAKWGASDVMFSCQRFFKFEIVKWVRLLDFHLRPATVCHKCQPVHKLPGESSSPSQEVVGCGDHQKPS